MEIQVRATMRPTCYANTAHSGAVQLTLAIGCQQIAAEKRTSIAFLQVWDDAEKRHAEIGTEREPRERRVHSHALVALTVVLLQTLEAMDSVHASLKRLLAPIW